MSSETKDFHDPGDDPDWTDAELELALKRTDLDWTYNRFALALARAARNICTVAGVSALMMAAAVGAEVADPHRDIPLREREHRLDGIARRQPAGQ